MYGRPECQLRVKTIVPTNGGGAGMAYMPRGCRCLKCACELLASRAGLPSPQAVSDHCASSYAILSSLKIESLAVIVQAFFG